MQVAPSLSVQELAVVARAGVADAVVAQIAVVVDAVRPCGANTGSGLVAVDGELRRRQFGLVRLVAAGTPLALPFEVIIIAED